MRAGDRAAVNTLWTLDLRKKRRVSEKIAERFFLLTVLISIAITLGIVAVLLIESAGFFSRVPVLRFFTDTQWTPLFANKQYGIWPLASGTFLTSLIAMLTAAPIGLISAIYLSEYAPEKVRRVLKPMLEILAGIPTIVYGYFALTFVTPVLQSIFPDLAGFNAISPGLVMGIMITPIIASLSEDAIYSVPSHVREGALALGSGKFRMIIKVLIPTAFSGIMASLLLGISRAVGETMIVAIAAGQQPVRTLKPMVPVETMTAYIVQVSLGDTPHGTLEYQTIFVVGMALFVFTFILNVVAHILRRYITRGKE